MKKLFFTSILALVAFFDAQAQQDPHYTQYMYNMNVINPAYAGSKENLSLGLLFRNMGKRRSPPHLPKQAIPLEKGRRWLLYRKIDR